MPITPSAAVRLLVAGTVLGVLGDALLRESHARAGFTIWANLFAGAALKALSWRSTDALVGGSNTHADQRALLGVAALIALAPVLRDAPMLLAANLFGLGVILVLLAWRAAGRPLTALQPRDALIGAAAGAVALAGGAPLLAQRARARQVASGDTASGDRASGETPSGEDVGGERGGRLRWLGIGAGSLVAAPVLLVTLLLLTSADPVFAALLDELGNRLDQALVHHLLVVGAVSWLSAGVLLGATRRVGIAPGALQRTLDLPFASAVPLLGGLTLLLGAWVAVQLRTLFGGRAWLEASGVLVANYARQGFFELVVVAGLVLGALLLADDLLERTDGPTRRRFRALGQLLVALVTAVLVSAVLRLALYLEFFGLTADRLFALAVLAWVALVIGWFTMTVLRGARTRFAPGVLVLSVLWLSALNVGNPERWVVAVNVARAEAGHPFDVPYHARLSADAVPALLAGADRLAPDVASALRDELRLVWSVRATERVDWRAWSLPWARAARAVR